jgi:hypothetical protein
VLQIQFSGPSHSQLPFGETFGSFLLFGSHLVCHDGGPGIEFSEKFPELVVEVPTRAVSPSPPPTWELPVVG